MEDETTLQMLKDSLRIDGDYDDPILKRNLLAAKVYLVQAIGEADGLMSDFYTSSEVEPLFTVALIALASTYYSYRVSVQISEVNPVDPISRSIIGQLRVKYSIERHSREKSKS